MEHFIRHFIVSVVLIACSLFGCRPQPRSIPTPAQPKPVITVCSGCGTEWRSYDQGPHNPISKCPECPMSIDEFEALKKAVRERNTKQD
jgi:hypothetical protein